MKQVLFEGPKPSLIYVFRIDDERHRDCLKVGVTGFTTEDNPMTIPPNAPVLREAATRRINQYTQTAGIAYELLYTECTMFWADQKVFAFDDKEVHDVLLRSGIERKSFEGVSNQGMEWFKCDLDAVKSAIERVKIGYRSLGSSGTKQAPEEIVFRPEQRRAIDATKERFRVGNRMLWNAKMRFGKTLSALQLVKELGFKRTLILTHRPVVNDSWGEGFPKIFYGEPDWIYGSRKKGETFESLQANAKHKHYIYFASIQDLRGSEQVGGKYNKNEELYRNRWDLLILDEAHEGTQTLLGQSVIEALIGKRTKVLMLTGTAYNLLDEFSDEDTFTWDYVMEQKAKAEWESTHMGDHNPYAELPSMNIYTYDTGKLIGKFEDEERCFSFKEFLKVDKEGRFVHEADVKAFLDLLTETDEESLYPFANDRYRSYFRHTLWMLPGVKEGKAMSAILKAHPVFRQFDIINVAGDGDDDEECSDALNMVKKAIGGEPSKTRTITLSCGRLTTGVTVGAWTAVLMLSGSYNTAASTYMQTIFRVQSPCKIDGMVKEECYVFDFAPDRCLNVLSSLPDHISHKGSHQSIQGKRAVIGELLNYFTVISQKGSRMEPVSVERMFEHLKRAYVAKVVQNGFEDSHLYNEKLMNLDAVDLERMRNLKCIIGKTNPSPAATDYILNNQGYNKEQRKNDGTKEKKPSKQDPEMEARKKEMERRRKLRDAAISVFRGISIRMPLLIYGANIKNEERDLTLDNFAKLIDDESWREFMPAKVDKRLFNECKEYYDPDIFHAAGLKIREMAKEADAMRIEDRIDRITSIFNTFRNPDKETVLTPWRTVNIHLGSTIGGFCFFNEDFSQPITDPRFIDIWGVTDRIFTVDCRLLELNSKSGLYPLYLAYSVYRCRLAKIKKKPDTLQEHQRIWDKTVADNIYVLCKTPMAKSITMRTLLGFRKGKSNLLYVEDLVNKIKYIPDELVTMISENSNYDEKKTGKMRFNAVVGNPPYQIEGANTRKTPIYPLFYDIAFRLSSRVSLITPGRFLFKAGQAPMEWMEKMLNDPHLKVVKYCANSGEVFPLVDIKGGIAITYRDAGQNFGTIGVFSIYDELQKIIGKTINGTKNSKTNRFSDIVSSQGMYRFSKQAFADFPDIETISGKGSGSKITSLVFAQMRQLFFDVKHEDGAIRIYGLEEKKRVYKWIRKEYLEPNDWCNYYKVIIPEANGSGAIGETLSTPIIGTPMTGHTDTFLSIGKFETEREAEACLKYVKSKFARTMLGTLKATQHNSRDTWANVPLQDFTPDSDIDWTKSVHEIDLQLYRKYNLNPEEISFIERMIRPMD